MGTVAALAAGLALAARAIAARHLRLPGRLASRPGTRVAMAALLLASAASPQPAAAPPPGVPNFAVLRAVEGAPDDSASAREFWAAFRGAFTGPSFATARPGHVPRAARAARRARPIHRAQRGAVGPGAPAPRERRSRLGRAPEARSRGATRRDPGDPRASPLRRGRARLHGRTGGAVDWS